MTKTLLMLGDCLARMSELEDESIDMALADPPYGTTICKWDSVIPLEMLWKQLKRIIKPNGAIVMTAQQPFTTKLISSNMKDFRYTWHWHKGYSTGYALCNKMPMKAFEDVVVFYRKLPVFNPQGIKLFNKIVRRGSAPQTISHKGNKSVIGGGARVQKYTGYPIDSIQTKKEPSKLHPTQKPVALMNYLIKTYTNENDSATYRDCLQ